MIATNAVVIIAPSYFISLLTHFLTHLSTSNISSIVLYENGLCIAIALSINLGIS